MGMKSSITKQLFLDWLFVSLFNGECSLTGFFSFTQNQKSVFCCREFRREIILYLKNFPRKMNGQGVGISSAISDMYLQVSCRVLPN